MKMLPLFALVRVQNEHSRGLRLWLPLFLLWPLLVPVVLLLSPLMLVACLVGHVNPFRVVSVTWQFCSGMTNTHVEVENPWASVLIRVF